MPKDSISTTGEHIIQQRGAMIYKPELQPHASIETTKEKGVLVISASREISPARARSKTDYLYPILLTSPT